ncbi:restriction endonuclease subunit S domain-containing protein [Pseudomonas chlororaphis]
MERLEIAEVNWSSLEFSTRLDAEYYRPNHLAAEKMVNERGSVPLESVCDFLIGPFGSAFTVENFTEDKGYRYIRGKDVKPMRLEENDNVYMPKTDFDRLSRYALQTGDILVSVVGTLGNSALIEKHHTPAIFSCKSTALRVKNIDPQYLLAYMNCAYGRDLLLRKERGAIQKGLNLDDLKSLATFVGSEKLQHAVARTFERSRNQRALSIDKLFAADETLNRGLNLDTWAPPETLSYVCSSSEAFAALRLDAEHFHPRYHALLELIDASGAGARLGDHLLENRRGKQPNYEAVGLPVVNSKHVLRNEVRLDDSNRVATSEEGALLIRAGDVLINGTGVGTIGRASAYLYDTPAIPDNHVTILRPDSSLDPVYLAVYLNSKAGQLQVDQRLRGSSGQIELYPADIAEFRVWLAPMPLQEDIRALVEQSFTHRQEAARLLDASKRAVEIAIELDETSALKYLSEVH